jgi:hypothetical protein
MSVSPIRITGDKSYRFNGILRQPLILVILAGFWGSTGIAVGG